MILIRFILIFLIVFLLVKGFIRSLFLEDPPEKKQETDKHEKEPTKKISKEVGEFIDYEEVD